MESNDEPASALGIRRTRSGRAVRPPPQTSPKATGRRTRKKMVLVEVEVSDEEDATQTTDTPNLELENSDNAMEALDVQEKTDETEKTELDTLSTVLEFPDDSNNINDVNTFKGMIGGSADDSTNNLDFCQVIENEFGPGELQSSPDRNEPIIEEPKTTSDLPENEQSTANFNQIRVRSQTSLFGESALFDVGKSSSNQGNVVAQNGKGDSMDVNQPDEPSADQPESMDTSEILQLGQEANANNVEEPMEAVESSKAVGAGVVVRAGNASEMEISDVRKTTNAEEGRKAAEAAKVVVDAENTETAVKDRASEKQSSDPDTEVISEDELPEVQVAKVPETEEVSDEELQVAKVPETEEVSDEELPGPKRAELPADTEVVSEDELPSVKKEGTKRKLVDGDYDPGSPTSESEAPSKKPALEEDTDKEKEEKAKTPKKLPELDKYWKAVNDDPSDFTGWTYLLQYVDQENDMEAAREAYDAFLSHYPYCYGYWRKYADYEKRKGNKKKCEEVFERGLKAIPLSVDLWIHYLTYVRTSRPDEEDFIRSQFERALTACGLEFRSDRLWDSYIKWETDAKRLQQVTVIYDRLLATPTQGYTSHFDNFQEHIASSPPNKVLEVDEFLALRKEVRHMLKHDVTTEPSTDNPDVPPGEDDANDAVSSDEETKAIRERIVSIRRKIHKNTVNAVTARWNFEEGIKRPYFHVKPLERCQLKNWQDYLNFEIEQSDQTRIIVLFERCLIACALYEEFWLKFVHYLEGLKNPELQAKVKDVFERACTIHHLKKPNLHMQWAVFEEAAKNFNRAAEILVNLEKSVPNLLQVAYRRINLERRKQDYEKCSQLYEHYITNAKNKLVGSNISIKYARFCHKVLKDVDKGLECLNSAITKDPNNPRLYLQLIDLTLQKGEDVSESDVLSKFDALLEKDNVEVEQKLLFAQRKLEFLEDFGNDVLTLQKAQDEYQKYLKVIKDHKKKDASKIEAAVPNKKEKNPPLPPSQSSSYNNYGNYGNTSASGSYGQYSGSQQGQYGYSQYGQNDQYQYQNWQYPQGGYGGYNQWGNYSGGYGY